tara:strand:- start:2255 stop:2722 length:468 start_codon:yes stop_codon:yes gene_type:complete
MAQPIQDMVSSLRFHQTQAQANGTPGMSLETTKPGPNGLVDGGMASKPSMGDGAQLMAKANKQAQDLKQNYVTAMSSSQVKGMTTANGMGRQMSQKEYEANALMQNSKATVLTAAANMGAQSPNLVAMANNELASAANQSVATQGQIKKMMPGLA